MGTMCGAPSAPTLASLATSARAKSSRASAGPTSLPVQLGDRLLPALESSFDRRERCRWDPADYALDALALELLEHGRFRRCAHHHDLDGPLRPRAQLPDPRNEVFAREVGQPTVAEGQHAIEHRRPVAADEHGRVWTLRGLRPGPDAIEVDVLAVIAGLVFGPDRLHRFDPLGHDRHAPARVGAVVLHLLAVPAGADAELEAPAR